MFLAMVNYYGLKSLAMLKLKFIDISQEEKLAYDNLMFAKKKCGLHRNICHEVHEKTNMTGI